MASHRLRRDPERLAQGQHRLTSEISLRRLGLGQSRFARATDAGFSKAGVDSRIAAAELVGNGLRPPPLVPVQAHDLIHVEVQPAHAGTLWTGYDSELARCYPFPVLFRHSVR